MLLEVRGVRRWCGHTRQRTGCQSHPPTAIREFRSGGKLFALVDALMPTTHGFVGRVIELWRDKLKNLARACLALVEGDVHIRRHYGVHRR